MPIAEARITTERPGRYLAQFCKHAAAMGSARGREVRLHGGPAAAHDSVQLHAEWSAIEGAVSFDPWGRCRLRAESDMLVVRVEAADDQALQRICDIIARDLDRFSHHDLTVDWQRVDATNPTRPAGGARR
jgi:hypothetical protein